MPRTTDAPGCARSRGNVRARAALPPAARTDATVYPGLRSRSVSGKLASAIDQQYEDPQSSVEQAEQALKAPMRSVMYTKIILRGCQRLVRAGANRFFPASYPRPACGGRVRAEAAKSKTSLSSAPHPSTDRASARMSARADAASPLDACRNCERTSLRQTAPGGPLERHADQCVFLFRNIHATGQRRPPP